MHEALAVEQDDGKRVEKLGVTTAHVCAPGLPSVLDQLVKAGCLFRLGDKVKIAEFAVVRRDGTTQSGDIDRFSSPGRGPPDEVVNGDAEGASELAQRYRPDARAFGLLKAGDGVHAHVRCLRQLFLRKIPDLAQSSKVLPDGLSEGHRVHGAISHRVESPRLWACRLHKAQAHLAGSPGVLRQAGEPWRA